MICLAKPRQSDCNAEATCTVTPAELCPYCCEQAAPENFTVQIAGVPKLYSVYIGGVKVGLVDAECFAELCKTLGVNRSPHTEGS